MAPSETAVTVGRDERDQASCPKRNGLDDQVGGKRSHVAQAALLPGGDDRPDADFVLDGGSRGRERDPPARAFAAPPDRPGGGRTAAVAERRGETRQCA